MMVEYRALESCYNGYLMLEDFMYKGTIAAGSICR